jgi:hypothetical protein
MNKLAKIIKELPLQDIELIKKDLEKGNIDRLINDRVKEINANRITLCPVCSIPVREGEGWHLQFGSPDLRKKATFDGADCLIYFLQRMKSK